MRGCPRFSSREHLTLSTTCSILINRLNDLGAHGSALDGFKSYLGDRKQTILIDGPKSTKTNLRFGIPQGSVLGPILFTIYTRPLENIAKKFGHNIIYMLMTPSCMCPSNHQTRNLFNLRSKKRTMLYRNLSVDG
jgi:hypothetical protein